MISDPNPFANLFNAQANVPQFAENSFAFNPLTTPPMPINPLLSPPIPAFAFTPPPTIPTNLDQLSDEELRLLEGTERQNVEERIKVRYFSNKIEVKRSIQQFLMNIFVLFSLPFKTVAQKHSTNDGCFSSSNESIHVDFESFSSNANTSYKCNKYN